MHKRQFVFGFGGGLTPVVRNLLIANVAVYVLQLLTTGLGNIPPLVKYFALRPDQILSQFYIWQVITYAFLHGNFFHIFFNMFTLWMFGCEVERYLGSKEFTKYYVITTVGAGLLQMLSNWGDAIYILGASGAIYGILVAFALFFPNRIVTLLLFFVLPVQLKAKHLVMIFIGISVVSGIQGQIFGVSDGVAHLAHLGGAAIGFIYLRGNNLVGQAIREIQVRKKQQQIRVEQKKQEELSKVRKQVDEILDHINQVGYKNISSEEKKFLKKASELLSKE